MAKVKLDPAWHGRRRIINLTLISCLGLVIYSISQGAPTAQAVVPSISLLASAIIGSYIFGASYERVSGIPSGNQTVINPAVTTTTVVGKPASPLPWGPEPNEL